MAFGRRRLEWQQTAAILAMIYNVNRDPKKGSPAKPEDFDPTDSNRSSKPIRMSVTALKTMFENRR